MFRTIHLNAAESQELEIFSFLGVKYSLFIDLLALLGICTYI